MKYHLALEELPFLLQTVLVSMLETGSVGGPCDQVQEAR